MERAARHRRCDGRFTAVRRHRRHAEHEVVDPHMGKGRDDLADRARGVEPMSRLAHALHDEAARVLPLLDGAARHEALDALAAFVAAPLPSQYLRATRTLRRAWFTGGCRFEPPRLLPDLESALSDVPLSRVKSRVETFFGSRPVDAGGYTAADFVAAVKRAVRQPLLA